MSISSVGIWCLRMKVLLCIIFLCACTSSGLNWGVQLKTYFGNIQPGSAYMDENEKMQTQLGLFEVDARLTDLLRRLEENHNDDLYRSFGLLVGAVLVAGMVFLINFKNKCGDLMGMFRSVLDRPAQQQGMGARPPMMQALPLYRAQDI